MSDGNGYLNSSFICLAKLENKVGGDSATRVSTRIRELETFVFSQPMEAARPSFKGYAPVVEDAGRATLDPSYGKDHLFGRVWVRPVLIEVGFITEELVYEIKIWNAWLSRSIDFTNVSVIAQDGTSLDYPALPYTMPQSGSLVLDLTVEKDGPTSQSTLYGLTLDGDVYNVQITGLRVIALEPDIEWDKSPKIDYAFQTVMFQDPARYQEQRRPLIEYPDRKQSVSYLLLDNTAHRIFNMFSYGHDKVFGVPIYNEKMVPSDITAGLDIIQLVTSTDYMYNLKNNCQFIIIVDHDNNQAEIKEIKSISANEIEVETVVAETFNLQTTFVYPALLSLIQASRFAEETDNIQIVTVDFKEFVA